MQESLVYTTHDTPIGTLLLVASRRGLRLVTLVGENEDLNRRLTQYAAISGAQDLMRQDGFFTSATAAIDDYLTHGTALKLPVDLAGGTALQRQVWLEIARIPHGEKISYSTLAENVGFPRAIRAVASACGANPVPLAIPCHRVLAKDGSLGGFSLGGLEVKEYLLRVESKAALAAA